MSRPMTSRLGAVPSRFRQPGAAVSMPSFQTGRRFSQGSPRWDGPGPGPGPDSDGPKRVRARPKTESFLESIRNSAKPSQTRAEQASKAMGDLAHNAIFHALGGKPGIDTSALSDGKPYEAAAAAAAQRREDDLEPFHLHVFSHKHNTHITCTKPSREPIISMSCGNIGFRKSRRGTFDSAYSLTKYVLERLTHSGWPMKMQRLELVLRGFGQGREAAVKVLMSPEGKILRDKIVRVADSTRVKFGGTRSEKPRRL